VAHVGGYGIRNRINGRGDLYPLTCHVIVVGQGELALLDALRQRCGSIVHKDCYWWVKGGPIRRKIVRYADNMFARGRSRWVLDLADLYRIDGRAVVAESLGAAGDLKPYRAVKR